MLQNDVYMKIEVVDIQIHHTHLITLVYSHPMCWLLGKIGCLATVAMQYTVQIGTTPGNV